MVTVNTRSGELRNLSTASTLLDAVWEFTKGRPKSGLLLLGAAAVSTRISGFGTIVSVFLRLYRRLR